MDVCVENGIGTDPSSLESLYITAAPDPAETSWTFFGPRQTNPLSIKGLP